MNKNFNILTANQAVALIAYKTNEVFPIYPITPASEMAELVEEWSAKKRKNIFGNIPTAFEMQSEAGVAGAMHGALQTGSLASTFTASQGLLLMLPNMYKIAGELTPNVIHVATRSIATHALSIFSDHSDIMSVRQSGYAILGSTSVQEAQDLALISQASSLKSKIPFVHFFDGFRTSHETSKIEIISDEVIRSLLPSQLIQMHRERALNPNHPIIRGTSQNSDIFFQCREAQNQFYHQCPEIVQEKMDAFAVHTGRHYKLFEYEGHPNAEHIIISMGSSTETIETTINSLNEKGERFGLIKVRLFRPFSTKHLLMALPKTVRSIAVLDRTKEPGSTGEPLYMDVIQSLMSIIDNHPFYSFPKVVGGRYGLASKEFKPSMVEAICDNLKLESPKTNFTIGINDDLTNLSLEHNHKWSKNSKYYEAIFYNTSIDDETTNSFKNIIQLIGSKSYIQGYDERDYRKSNSRFITNFRISDSQIKAPYLIDCADFIGCQNIDFINNDNVIDRLGQNAILIVNSSLSIPMFLNSISIVKLNQLQEKNVLLYIVDLETIPSQFTINDRSINSLHACFLAISNNDYTTKEILQLKDKIKKVLVDLDKSCQEHGIDLPKTMLQKLLANQGDLIPVSQVPSDGTFDTNTSLYNPSTAGNEIPVWDTNLCTQCGACSMACPQAALRIKVYDDSFLEDPTTHLKSIESNYFDLLKYTIQINPEQCNSCNNCVDSCVAKALTMTKKNNVIKQETKNWHYFNTIPEFDRTKLNFSNINQQQLQEPLFKYSIGVEGCGEAPYLKLMSQLFGNRLLIANATGASSIFGGALPTTPWAKDKNGRGPAWSNSLFEDNAEFGLGFRLSLDQQEAQAKSLLEKLLPQLDGEIVNDILNANQATEAQIVKQRNRVEQLNTFLKSINSSDATLLASISDALVKKSVWILGGDGWAYDIGFGGIDHVLASGRNVNILVLDNEVYSNTGGQTSKATPFGAKAKFSFHGKMKQKKDLGKIAMTYDNVYVASVAIGADQEQTLKAFNEAESFEGPSLIIAYCHSESHGIDMKNPSQYHKAAVSSGQWMLYRNDPRKPDPFQLDFKSQTLKIEDYLKLENRFNDLFNNNGNEANSLIKTIQNQVNNKFAIYKKKERPKATPLSFKI